MLHITTRFPKNRAKPGRKSSILKNKLSSFDAGRELRCFATRENLPGFARNDSPIKQKPLILLWDERFFLPWYHPYSDLRRRFAATDMALLYNGSFPVFPTRRSAVQVKALERFSACRPAPAHTVPGSLPGAGGLLVSVSAIGVILAYRSVLPCDRAVLKLE